MSVSLCMIAPTKADAQPFIDKYGKYFDEVIVQESPDVKNFADARNKALKKVKTDYWFWADVGDSIKNPERIQELVSLMDKEGLDAVYLPYEYGYNEQGEVIALHWRERIIRTSHPFEWKGAVHETLISSESPKMVKDASVVIQHEYKTEEDIKKSVLRNHKIMEEQVKKGDEDPRLLYYLGRSYFMLERFTESAQTLMIYIEKSGWDEQKYDAWLKIGDALLMMDEHDKSLNANLEAIKLSPNVPDAYLKMGDLYLALEQPERAIEWLKIGLTKPQPKTLEIVDPTLYTYRPLVSLAMAYFRLADVNQAKTWIDKAFKYQPKTKLFKNVYNAVTQAYKEELSIKQAVILGKLVETKGDVKKYMEGLPTYIRNDLRLRPLRVKAFPPKKWPEKSIVFYCGEQWEEWGPDTLKNGMGGSEEAIVYLSRELANLGWKVVVYNQRVEPIDGWEYSHKQKTAKGGYVMFLPWETFNPEDEFDVFVAWRNPRMIDQLKIKARVKAVDFHDTPIGHQAVNKRILDSIDIAFLKSEFQRELGEIPKDKCAIIPNGIVPEQFDVDVERNPKKVIYASSADRGLDTLVREVWPRVKEEVPDAELVWPYGWDSYRGMHKSSSQHMKWMWEMKRDMLNLDVKELGRLSHEDLAREFLSSNVFAYPTYFDEISCLTAMKAQASKCKIITTGRAALQETIFQEEEDSQDINKFTDRLIKALKEPRDEKALEEVKKKTMDKYSWVKVARRWDEVLRAK